MLNVKFLLFINLLAAPAQCRHFIFRITGGRAADTGSFPYQVSLHRMLNSQFFCGGAIVNDLFVLTAAHCIKDIYMNALTANQVFITAGQLGRYVSNGSITRALEEIVIHPKFDPEAGVHDIAILALAKKLPTTKVIATIPMNKKTVVENTTCVVTGWGAEVSGQSSKYYPKTLLRADVDIVNHDDCKRKYKMNDTDIDITDEMICAFAFGKDGKALDSCQGDSGGPLACHGRLVGIVSFGVGCGDVQCPGIYTHVMRYLPWIHSEMARVRLARSRSKITSAGTQICNNYHFLVFVTIKYLLYIIGI